MTWTNQFYSSPGLYAYMCMYAGQLYVSAVRDLQDHAATIHRHTSSSQLGHSRPLGGRQLGSLEPQLSKCHGTRASPCIPPSQSCICHLCKQQRHCLLHACTKKCICVLNHAQNAPRPLGWTSADAAGLPIYPTLIRADEVLDKGVITHAIRFTGPNSR